MDDQPPLSPPPLAPPPGRERARPEPAPAALPPQRSRGRAIGWLLVIAVLIGAVVWIVYRVERQPANTGRFTSSGPMPVGTAKTETGDMPVDLIALGTVTPLATVTLKTQINGQLTEVAFQEGQMVKKGDFLAQIDPRPYQVALEQAQGQLAKDTALLKGAEVDLARYKTLVAQNSIARQTYDTQTYLVQQDRGIVQSDQAQVDTQELNLAYCHIVSPVGGRIGLRQVDAGNYVQTSDANGLVVITQLEPISVIFTLPEDSLPQVLKQVHAGATLAADAFDRTDTTHIDSGKLATIDNQIDTSTGTLKLRAVFDNKDEILFPNQFVNIHLRVDTLKGATLAPQAAIQRGAPGTFVYIVKPDNTVTAQAVTLGPGDSKNVVVTKGLGPGQTVVIDGADRLKEGAKVNRVAEPAAAGSAGTSGQPPAPAAGAPTQPAPASPANPAGKGPGAAPGDSQGQHQRRQRSNQ